LQSEPSQPVILIGASTRAAATSAVRAGWSPWCVDLFGDADLECIAVSRKISRDDYPQGLIDALADAPPAPVVYTGALENHPDLIARIDRPLWGNPPEVLRAIRMPEAWTRCLQEAGIACPALSEAPTEGRWLLKSRKSAGGLNVRTYTGQTFSSRTHFLQQHIDGMPASAVYLGQGDGATLLGVTEQFVGTPWLNTDGFHYAGNIGPIPLADTASHWRHIGATLARQFHLRGLFGVDAILRDGVPWPIEINPRYTASIEVLERSARAPFLRAHRDVFLGKAGSPVPLGENAIWGKAILYARDTIHFPSEGPWSNDSEELDQKSYADLPHAGEVIERGCPLLTMFASGETVASCRATLQEMAEALDRRLWG
jgi:predicted ATP-grasp superfamily ATP-dependent carboligase